MSYLRTRYMRRRTPGGLGDAATPVAQPVPDSTASQEQWQQQMLSTAQNHLAYVRQKEQRERFQKWIQIGVTASIPVFGGIWKFILGRKRAKMSL